MMDRYLTAEAARIESTFDEDVETPQSWQSRRDEYKRQYLYMLGLHPLPPRSDLRATITGSVEREDFIVDNLHFQSRPRLYATGNLYRPKHVEPDERLPAVLYLCGHANRGRDGNKSAYQSHGIWLARHGYICLTLDTLQLGEIAGAHHGTYKLQRWSWHSRGYTPAGVEAWNGIRGIDYLISRPDVDADRIGVTGISGGGATTFWIAAADERVKAAVPVSGMADLSSYIGDHVINGHCDCMFMYNAHRWPWTRIAALIAPRPLLVINSDQDDIFPMDANERVARRLEEAYRLFGAGDQVDVMTSIGDHAYRKDIRQAAYRFLNVHLKNDPRGVTDSEVDLYGEAGPDTPAISPQELRVFPTDADLPDDQLNTTIDEHFVPVTRPPAPNSQTVTQWQCELSSALRRSAFAHFPAEIPPAHESGRTGGMRRLASEESIEFRLQVPEAESDLADKILLVVCDKELEKLSSSDRGSHIAKREETVVYCLPRGVGPTKWTTTNPPNYVERSHALIGRTVDAGRVWDVIATAKYLQTCDRAKDANRRTVRVAGRGAAGVIAAYAAALEPQIAGAVLVRPMSSHRDNSAPQFLNVLRVCDVPDALGLIAPRELTVLDASADKFSRTMEAFAAAGAEERLSFR